MLTVTSAQLDAWLAALLFPLARILALVTAAPVFGNSGLPLRVRIGVGLAIALVLVPAVPPLPPIAPASGIGLTVLAQQVLIGLAMGFTMRIVFAAIDLAGELVGLQMGLSFALFFDPGSSGQTAVLSEFLGVLGTLVFLALNGHLMMISVLSASFDLLPIAAAPLSGQGFEMMVRWGAVAFAAGVLLAIPLIVTLLVTNIALLVLTRAAPQLNLFAVGFPITLTVGFGVLLLSLPLAAPLLERLFEQGLAAMEQYVRAAAPAPL